MLESLKVPTKYLGSGHMTHLLAGFNGVATLSHCVIVKVVMDGSGLKDKVAH